jgi:hypothetical protein
MLWRSGVLSFMGHGSLFVLPRQDKSTGEAFLDHFANDPITNLPISIISCPAALPAPLSSMRFITPRLASMTGRFGLGERT